MLSEMDKDWRLSYDKSLNSFINQGNMQKAGRFAFDLGGVIIQRGAMENYLVEESIVSVKLTVQKFSPQNVFIVSKAKQKYIERNIQLLKKHDFFNQTGLLEQNVYFVNEYEDKGALGKKLELSYILDDSVKVAKIAIQAGFTPILFGHHEEFIKQNNQMMNAKNWKGFRKILERLKK